MDQQLLHTYARLLLETGLAFKKGQPLIINAEVQNEAFVTIVTEEAYNMGASNVVINWRHNPTNRLKLLHATEEVLTHPAQWIPTYYQQYVDERAAFLSLISANPKALAGIPPQRLTMSSKAMNETLKFYHTAIMSSHVTWCVAAVPTELWADLLGYTGTKEEKIDHLWHTILQFSRLEGVVPSESFKHHLSRLQRRKDALNRLDFAALQYTCDNGTNLLVRLPENHLWQGGAEPTQDGTIFCANIPTEEVYCAPQWDGVDGIVYSTKPLVYHGNPIEDFSITFSKGRIVDYTAKVGYDILKELIETDEGSHYLGEVALVDHYSPISQSNIIFNETLFDENASCHLAIGAAYPTNLKDSDGLTREQLKERGLNDSLTHVDFMIGHESMHITGITKDGQRIPVMQEGRFVLDVPKGTCHKQ